MSSYLPPESSYASTRKERVANIRVFMDVEDYPIPIESLDPISVYEKIKSGLEEKGYRGSVSIYLFADEKNNTLTEDLIEKYKLDGINIFCVPEVAGVKFVRVHHMLLEMYVFALHNHHEKTNMMLLSKGLKEDSYSIRRLNGLHSRGYNILISESSEWIWRILLSDGGNPSGSSSDKKLKTVATDSRDKKRKTLVTDSATDPQDKKPKTVATDPQD